MFAEKKIPAYKRYIESELERALLSLKGETIGSDDYKKTIDKIVTLHGLMDKPPAGVSKDTLAVVTGNLLGIALILKHEYVNVITSKAMSLVIKPR